MAADLLALVLVGLVALPLAQLLLAAASQGLGPVARALTAPGAARALANTIGVGVSVSILSVVVGLGAAMVTDAAEPPDDPG